jgi:hypothetical protein
MRTPPLGMSGVQVLGTGGSLGGVAEGRHNSIRCIRHSKRGRPPAAPSHPVSPRQRMPPQAKAQFQKSWEAWKAWAKLKEAE